MLTDTQIEQLRGYLDSSNVLTIEYPCDIHGSFKVVSEVVGFRYVDIIDREGRTEVLSVTEVDSGQPA
jgi:hypothetical protein